ncbi:MAG: NUDIX hydrolase [Nanoarchaeota archaeon]
MGNINWKDKCWVTTIFLVDGEGKVLLTWNKNLQTWIPVGGHIDEGETPEQAIRREVAEETGFDFTFHEDFKLLQDGKVKISNPFKFQIEEVPHHGHHMNFVFLGKCSSHDSKVSETDEQEKLRWFSEEELKNENMLESVKNSALDAVNFFK